MKSIFTSLLIFAVINNPVHASCTRFQGVLLCDNGDIETERFDGVYSLVGNQLHVERFNYDYLNYYPSHIQDRFGSYHHRRDWQKSWARDDEQFSDPYQPKPPFRRHNCEHY